MKLETKCAEIILIAENDSDEKLLSELYGAIRTTNGTVIMADDELHLSIW